MSPDKNLNSITFKLEASNFLELQKLMLKNNVLNNKMFEYFQIVETETKAIAYFRADASTYKKVGE